MPRTGSLPLAAAALALSLGACGWLEAARRPALPGCAAAATPERLGRLLETIPALAGRGARLVALETPRRRGHAGAPRLIACQGRLVTTRGAGALEYSIRPAPGAPGGVALRAELFQGGWRAALVPEGRARAVRASSRAGVVSATNATRADAS